MLTLLPIQSKFVNSSAQEVLLSLPPAGGSTTALLSAALNAVQAPNTRALIINKYFSGFEVFSAFYQQFGGVTDKLRGRTIFPNGSIIQYGFIAHDEDVKKYISAEFSFIGIELLHTMSDSVFFWLKSRLRNEPGLLRYTGSISAIRKIKKWIITVNERGKKEKFLNPQWGLKKHFMKRNLSGARVVLERKILDNPYLDKEVIENLNKFKAEFVHSELTFHPAVIEPNKNTVLYFPFR